MKIRASFLLALVGLSSGLLVAPSSALDRGSIGTMSPEKRHIEFTGTPIAGIYPYSNAPAEPYANFKPTACRSVTYCDTVEFEVDYPSTYLREVFFGITISLTWDNPYHDQKNPTGNDLDLFLWGNDDPVSGGPASKCGSPTDPLPGEEGARCNNVFPEVIAVTEPPNTTADDADPAAILLTVVNDKSINTGYKIAIDWYTFDIAPPPAFTPPDRETSFRDKVRGPFDFKVTKAKEGVETPAPTPRTILVPGPDGKLHEVELPIYAAGQRLGTTAERSNTVPWVIAAVVGVLAVGALIFYLMRLNRRAMET